MNNKYTIQNPMPPIWMMYPYISQYSIGWRMGAGEGYKFNLQDWLKTLNEDDRKKYDEMFPKPIFWRDFEQENEDDYCYEFLIDFWQKYGIPKLDKATLSTIQKKLNYIYFWKTNPQKIDKGCLSQWQYSEFAVDIDEYFFAEQYMMAEKARVFEDKEIRKEILQSKDPKQIKALGRKVKNFNQEIWDTVKYSIVLNGNYYKFAQNKAMRDYLFSTGDSILVEASPLDRIWGIGLGENNEKIHSIPEWRGQNLLGFALMEVREELKRVYKNYDKINWENIKTE